MILFIISNALLNYFFEMRKILRRIKQKSHIFFIYLNTFSIINMHVYFNNTK